VLPQITLSADHYLLVAPHKDAAFTQRTAVPAAHVAPGTLLWRRTDSGSLAIEAVTSVQHTLADGLVNPFTLRGAIPLTFGCLAFSCQRMWIFGCMHGVFSHLGWAASHTAVPPVPPAHPVELCATVLAGNIVVDGVAASVYNTALGAEARMHAFMALGRGLWRRAPWLLRTAHHARLAQPLSLAIGRLVPAVCDFALLDMHARPFC
jgi:hypothetical protein